MKALEAIKKAAVFAEVEETIEDEKNASWWAYEFAESTNDDWDNKGFIRTNVVQTDEDEFYSIESEHCSNGDFYGFCGNAKKVKQKTKTVTYFE